MREGNMASNVDVVKGIYDAFAKGDVPAVLGAFDEKIDWQEPETLPFEDQIGPQGVGENIFGPLVGMFPNFTVTTREIHEAGDVVFSLGTYRGTAAETGKDLETEFVHVWRLTDGKVAGFRTYSDTHAWLQALGKT
jgi:ketosteroid isomerase-like protein